MRHSHPHLIYSYMREVPSHGSAFVKVQSACLATILGCAHQAPVPAASTAEFVPATSSFCSVPSYPRQNCDQDHETDLRRALHVILFQPSAGVDTERRVQFEVRECELFHRVSGRSAVRRIMNVVRACSANAHESGVNWQTDVAPQELCHASNVHCAEREVCFLLTGNDMVRYLDSNSGGLPQNFRDLRAHHPSWMNFPVTTNGAQQMCIAFTIR